ncbi:hypothetical protein CWN95_17725 [Vibrio splendidus]|nr:hypothetical protein A144_11885 [Vibrio splendidus ZF-90]PTP32884.1 hypothetical protein CWN95_17725 [Vibrio splendidus]
MALKSFKRRVVGLVYASVEPDRNAPETKKSQIICDFLLLALVPTIAVLVHSRYWLTLDNWLTIDS